MKDSMYNTPMTETLTAIFEQTATGRLFLARHRTYSIARAWANHYASKKKGEITAGRHWYEVPIRGPVCDALVGTLAAPTERMIVTLKYRSDAPGLVRIWFAPNAGTDETMQHVVYDSAFQQQPGPHQTQDLWDIKGETVDVFNQLRVSKGPGHAKLFVNYRAASDYERIALEIERRKTT